jgi:hypothetical protein
MQHPAEFYLQQVAFFEQELSRLRRKLLIVSVLRLACFLGILILAFRTYKAATTLNITLLTVLVAAFAILLRRFSGTRAQRTYSENLLRINQNEQGIAQGKGNKLGRKYEAESHCIYSDDLDVTGPGSLYEFINRTTTGIGATSLVNRLQNTVLEKQTILRLQEAISQLSEQPGACQRVMARGLTLESADGHSGEINTWLHQPARLLNKKWLNAVRFLLPAFNLIALWFYLDTNNPLPVIVGIVSAWLILTKYIKYITRQHILIGRKEHILEQNASILKQFLEVRIGSSSILTGLHRTADDGNKAIKKLSQLSSLFDQRLNLLVNVFLNSLLLYDLHVVHALEKWKSEHARDFPLWESAIGEIEMLLSFAVFRFNHPQFVFPNIVDGPATLQATDLAHPLIPSNESVPNDVQTGSHSKLLIITGSNMSGKSTFLRTVGINLLLAQCGAPVCATSFTFSPMQILSSIRISDSLQDHTSYFMAELLRLKSIITELEKGEPALVLIDEVLRGTNSNDKSYGSEFLIRRLVKYNAITFFATHDLALSRLDQQLDGLAVNFCFESTIANGELKFDYKLHKGVAKNRNATFLMQKMGIIA